jgi:hypothetical protein
MEESVQTNLLLVMSEKFWKACGLEREILQRLYTGSWVLVRLMLLASRGQHVIRAPTAGPALLCLAEKTVDRVPDCRHYCRDM